MRLNLERGDGQYRIRGYEPGRLTINETIHEASLIVTPTRLIEGWPPSTVGELRAEHFDAILALEPEVILLGTGETQHFPDTRLLRAVLTRGTGIEVMDTGSACRTFNVLMAESRRVAAALIV